ncbi:MAG TPA: hypothetical protein VND93_28555, partial [Myxococcales bacterium]|nr:hypothetical protein [Myxococcales bacterium]
MRLRFWWALAISVALATVQGCDCNGGGGNDGGDDGGDDGGVVIPTCPAGLQSIAVSPSSSTVQASGSGTVDVQLSATGTLAGGGTQDLSGALGWTLSRDDDSPPGTVTQGGLFTSAPGVGGVTTVTASCQGVSGTATVTVVLQGVSFTSGDGGTPSDFAGTPIVRDATRSPVIVYPSHQTRFPRNIYKVLFQWTRKGNDKFRITFAGPFSTTQVYTDGRDPQCAAAAATAGCWESPLAAWTAIAGSNAGHPVTVTVDGVLTGDARVFQSAPITIAFSRRDVRGAIFYWSTTAAGIRRANVSDAVPEPYEVAKPIPTALDDGSLVKCVACHTVSRSGQRIIAFTQTSTTTGEFTYNVRPASPPEVLITTQINTAKGFGTFSPDDSRVVATVGNQMAEFDAVTGTRFGTLPVAAGTNPDWSPSDLELVYSDKAGDSPGSANLSVLTRSDGGWANPRVLVPAAGLTNLFPSYTFDGQFIAYSRGKGGHGDKTLQLWLARADGGGPPMELVTANRVVSSVVTNGQFENNMPTWAPPGDLEWVAFNSLRPYGVVLPGGGTQQIWVAAVDRARMVPGTSPDGGIDPSYPAFRFAFQNLNEDNHRAYWTLDVRYDKPDGGSCRPKDSACDSNTTCCSGLECQPASEVSYVCEPP